MKPLNKIGRGGAPDRVVVVGVQTTRMTRGGMERSLAELERLIDTAGGEVIAHAQQLVRRVDPATFVGKGKVAEIAQLVREHEADMVAFDEELTPVQNRNLEKALESFVIDRTAVILDIFARRAHTREGKLQVELAQLEYLAPRLVGRGKSFSQQVGRIGTRGPGETALEYDRRRIRERMTLLRRRLEEVRKQRRIHRMKREAVPIPLVSMVGYTNAGKSTLLNALTGADAFVEDKLFATLDPTVRRLRLPSGREVLLADTVGFIRRLPHQLVDAFRATFEEVAHAHMLLHVVDGTDEEATAHREVVERVLAELELNAKPRLDVINKCDRPQAFRAEAEAIALSARTGEGLDRLRERLDEILRLEFHRALLRLPLDRGDILSTLYRLGYVGRVEYDGSGILVDCELHRKYYQKYRAYAVED